MATAAQLKRLRRKYHLGEFSKKRRRRKAKPKVRRSRIIKKPNFDDTTDLGIERIQKYKRAIRRRAKRQQKKKYKLDPHKL